MKYVYTAVFSPAENGMVTASVPDLPGCITEGNGLADAIEMITDAAEMWLWDAEINHEAIPSASALEAIQAEEGAAKSLVLLDTDAYRRANNGKSVRKSVTLPEWMNQRAEAADVNFSHALQRGVCEELGIPW